MDPINGKGPDFGMGTNSTEKSPESIQMPEDTYCFKTDFIEGEYGVNAVFEESRHFEKVESTDSETKYAGPEMTVRVDSYEGAVEYAVENHREHDQAVQEFVDGIVHSIEDVTPEFRKDIEDEIYKQAVADGGKETGMPYGGSMTTVENVSESDSFMGDYPM